MFYAFLAYKWMVVVQILLFPPILSLGGSKMFYFI